MMETKLDMHNRVTGETSAANRLKIVSGTE